MTFCYILPLEPFFCVSSNNWLALALVPLFHGGNFLVKSLSLLIAHCPKFFWEEV